METACFLCECLITAAKEDNSDFNGREQWFLLIRHFGQLKAECHPEETKNGLHQVGKVNAIEIKRHLTPQASNGGQPFGADMCQETNEKLFHTQSSLVSLVPETVIN